MAEVKITINHQFLTQAMIDSIALAAGIVSVVEVTYNDDGTTTIVGSMRG